MPTISVIVPVYKVEEYLPRCVDSILGQSFPDFELILVDDGSPDRCGALCEGYAETDGRIHVIHRKNGGLSAARNSGLDWVYANSDSQWIAFVDSDDWVHGDYLRQLYRAAVEHDCRISACGFFRTEHGPFPQLASEPSRCLTADGYYCGGEIHGGTTAVAWNKLYHRSLLERLRYPEGKLHEDEFTTYRAVYAAGKIAVVEAPLYAYYQNPQGIMLSKWNPRRLHILEAFEQQMTEAKQQKLEGLYAHAVRNYIFGIHGQLQKAEKSFHKQLRSKYRSGLALGRQCGVFPLTWENLWAYEEAYPVKLIWWPLFKGRYLLDKLLGKDNKA